MPANDGSNTRSASDFQLSARNRIESLAVVLEEYRHPCGARHYHLANDDPHRSFMVAFRTPPADDTGLPHILEHTTLCGSRRFPVRDPFFKMLRRSLQTFMNAMTFPDMTCYPFASQVAKDFDNLLSIYVDAVFDPLLDPLDFAQEGHRLEPDGAGAGPGWRRKGVVFNEMKGAMDGTDAQMEAALARVLLPDTPYRFNSGGDPAAIPRLGHRDLVAFHQRSYCPGNACFATYGDVDVPALHRLLRPYLAVEPGAPLPPAPLQPPLRPAPRLEVPVPLGPDQDPLDVTSATLTWVWGDVADIDEVLTGELLDRLLLGHAGAPLRLALENSGLGRAIGGSGYNAGYRNGLFSAELDGIAPDDYERFAPLVLGSLEATADAGFAEDEVQAALHQVEVARREIHGDHYPYGLELCLRIATGWNHAADPRAFLDQAPAIERLRARCADPAWLPGELRRRLLANQHRVLALARPDTAFHDRALAEEQAHVAAETAALDAQGEARLRGQATALAERQASPDDAHLLPDLRLDDVPARRRWAEGRDQDGITVFVPGTNGLLHHLVALPIPDLAPDELDLLPLLTQTIGNLGVGRLDYAAHAARLNACCAGLWSWFDVVADPDDLGRLRAVLFCEVKGLATRQADFVPLLAETLAAQRFDEHERLAELVEQSLQRMQDRVQSSGSALAARAAARGLGGAAALGHRLSGFGRLAWLKRIAARIDADGADGERALAGLADGLAGLLGRLRRGPPALAVIGDQAGAGELLARVRASWGAGSAERAAPFASLPAVPAPPTAWTTATAVNYSALVFPCVPMGHADAGPLTVAGHYLTHNVLHARIREQGGAYGAGAGYAAGTGTFSLTSYRDPRLAATHEDMRAGLAWLAAIGDDERPLREAILATIAGLDAPSSPAGEAKSRFAADLKGVGPDRLDRFRSQVLATTSADIRRVAATWLSGPGTLAAVTSPDALAMSGLGWASEAI